MSTHILIWVVGVLAIAAAGTWLTARRTRRPAVPGRSAARWVALLDGLVQSVGRIGAAVIVLAAGSAISFAVGWPLGRLAAWLEDGVDVPVFEWFQERFVAGPWSSVQDVLTQMGNRPEVKVVAIVSAVVLGAAWRRRWWVPVAVILTAFVVEKYVQTGLARVVDRGHPPTHRGTYPSGGCARLVSIYGSILFLALRTWRPAPWVAGLLWTVLAEAAWMEGYARTYRLEHWFTDVVGGWALGIMLLGVFVATAVALDHVVSRRPATADPTADPTPDPTADPTSDPGPGLEGEPAGHRRTRAVVGHHLGVNGDSPC